MAAKIYLRDDVYVAVLGDDVVLLDMAADAYLCLPDAGPVLTIAPADGEVSTLSAGAARDLLTSGLATYQTPRRRWPTPPPLPSRGVDLTTRASRIRARDVIRLFGCLVDLALHYRGRRFSEILSYARASRLGARPASERDTLVEVVRRFHVAAVWLPAPGKCLVRSFLLLRYLHRSGFDADWVVGVRTWPFAAHCWLQVGDCSLDDAPERLVSYQPICVA
jgi:hypothetical protein